MTAQETNVANAFETTLTVEMGASDLTANVVTTSGGPASPCYLVIEPDENARREIVLFDGTFTGTTFVASNINKRYLSGSAAGSGLTHAIGSVVRSCPLDQHWEDINDRVDAAGFSVINAAGDLVYGTANDTAARLAIGTARQQLATNAGATAPEWVASLQSLLTTTGDIVIASAANTPARLAASTSGYVLTSGGAGVAPSWAASGSSLTSASGHITGDVTLTASTTVDIFSTSSLDTGTWLVSMGTSILSATASTNVAVQCVVGTATATFTGQRSGEFKTSDQANDRTPVSLSFMAEITVAGTLKLRAHSAVNNSVAEQLGATLGSVPETGYTAIKIA
jgi:hypothetical protein